MPTINLSTLERHHAQAELQVRGLVGDSIALNASIFGLISQIQRRDDILLNIGNECPSSIRAILQMRREIEQLVHAHRERIQFLRVNLHQYADLYTQEQEQLAILFPLPPYSPPNSELPSQPSPALRPIGHLLFSPLPMGYSGVPLPSTSAPTSLTWNPFAQSPQLRPSRRPPSIIDLTLDDEDVPPMRLNDHQPINIDLDAELEEQQVEREIPSRGRSRSIIAIGQASSSAMTLD